MTTVSDAEIAPYYRVSDWRKLDLSDPSNPHTRDWQDAISAIQNRLRARFFDAVDTLIAAEAGQKPQRYGFAVLAIDCLLIETIQGFREGIADHRGRNGPLFKAFLKNWTAFANEIPAADLEKWIEVFWKSFRCALLHSGATGVKCKVGVTGPILSINGGEIKVNRSAFHLSLKNEFNRYIEDLKSPQNAVLRTNFVSKMTYICS